MSTRCPRKETKTRMCVCVCVSESEHVCGGKRGNFRVTSIIASQRAIVNHRGLIMSQDTDNIKNKRQITIKKKS